MEIIHIEAKNIETFAQKYFRKDTPVIPITPWRALSQRQNPFADENNVLLIAAIDEEDNLLGYVGILPGKSHLWPHKKIFWLSCWWRIPSKNSYISRILINEFLKVADNNVLFSALTDKTNSILKRIGDVVCFKRKGILLRFRSGFSIRARFLKQKNRLFRFFYFIFGKTRLLNLIDVVINIFLNKKINTFLSTLRNDDLIVNRHELPGEEIFEFIQSFSNENFVTLPNKDLAEWWVKTPWIVEPDKSNIHAFKAYYFSSHANSFTNYWFEVRFDGNIIGVADLTFRDGAVKTPFLFYKAEFKDKFFTAILQQVFKNTKNHSLLSFHEEFSEFIKSLKDLPGKYSQEKRYAALSKKLKKQIETRDLIFQDGDGDVVFT